MPVQKVPGTTMTDRDVTSADLDFMILILQTQVTSKDGKTKYTKSWQPLEFKDECNKQGIPTKAVLQGIKMLMDDAMLHCHATTIENKTWYYYSLHTTHKNQY
jgi:hypothetical protein